MKLRPIVVNMARRQDRLTAFGHRFGIAAPGVPVARFEAVDGRALFDSPFIQQLFRGNDFEFRAPVIGCALSHFEIWHQLLNDPASDAYLIFEDDVLFVDGFWRQFQNVMQNTPRGEDGVISCDFLFLGGMEPAAPINQVLAAGNPNVAYGTYSYIVTKSGASRVIALATRDGIKRGLDWFLANHFGELRTMVAVPWLCSGLLTDSDVQKGEGQVKNTDVPRPIEPIIRDQNGKIPVHLRCNWCTSNELRESWNKLTEGNYTWGSIVVVPEEKPAGIEIIVNSCDARKIGPRSILLQMEPSVGRRGWGLWESPPQDFFAQIFSHGQQLNAVEWHLSLSRAELLSSAFPKTATLSTVTSGKYFFEGQKKRLDFIKFLDDRGVAFDFYGRENPFSLKAYKGALPAYKKDIGILPYKYTIGVENSSENGYATEKIWDGILAECLTFYWGCPNLEDFIDPLSFVRLDLNDFEKAAATINAAIEENLWEVRLPHIRAAKAKLLGDLSIFPRLESVCLALASKSEITI